MSVSFDGLEDKVMNLFCEIEKHRQVKERKERLKTSKGETRVRRDLKRFISMVDYDGPRNREKRERGVNNPCR